MVMCHLEHTGDFSAGNADSVSAETTLATTACAEQVLERCEASVCKPSRGRGDWGSAWGLAVGAYHPLGIHIEF